MLKLFPALQIKVVTIGLSKWHPATERCVWS